MISLPCGWTELLADEATGNHRGAPLDGRPREGEMIGPMSGHRVSQSAHPTRKRSICSGGNSWRQASTQSRI